MSLAALIRGQAVSRVATATPATTATPPVRFRPVVANVANVAVANGPEGESPARLSLDFEERAAIREYDGGFPRYEAERLARLDLAAMEPWGRA